MSDDGAIEPADLFVLATEDGELDPKAIAKRLVDEVDDFAHLKHGEAVVLFLMRTAPKEKMGKTTLGQMALPVFGGKLADLGAWLLAKVCGGMPDFIMVLDQTWWVQATPIQREALVYHELCHAAHAQDRWGEPRFTPDGDPVWAIAPHDLEEFNAVARRYGAVFPDIETFVAAVHDGGGR